MHPRRPLLKRVAVWTAAVVLLLALYVLGGPFVILLCERHGPAIVPVLEIIYAPLMYVDRDSQAPGHFAFQAYAKWCDDTLDRAFGDF
jgi:hypothetical protein